MRRALAFAALACLPALACQAGDGRLLATGGAIQIDGAAGGRNLLRNGSQRATRASPTGLLGFGGDRRSGYSVAAEDRAAVLLDPRWALGARHEYRQKSTTSVSPARTAGATCSSPGFRASASPSSVRGSIWAGRGITTAQFNALAEDLTLVRDRRRAPVAAQNRLLRQLAPMHGDVTGP